MLPLDNVRWVGFGGTPSDTPHARRTLGTQATSFDRDHRNGVARTKLQIVYARKARSYYSRETKSQRIVSCPMRSTSTDLCDARIIKSIHSRQWDRINDRCTWTYTEMWLQMPFSTPPTPREEPSMLSSSSRLPTLSDACIGGRSGWCRW